MKCKSLLASIAAAAFFATAPVHAAETTLNVLYPYPYLFEPLQKELAEKFTAEHPDIKIKFVAPSASYEEGAQKILRGSVTGSMPDVAFNGLSWIRVFVDKDIAVPLDPFIAKETNWKSLGYSDQMVGLGQMGGKTYALPFAISTPILYFNTDLVKKAGGDPDNLPKTWPDVVALGKKIQALGGGVNGLFFLYSITGNWMLQALVFGDGGRLTSPDEQKIAFGDAAGKFAFDTLHSFGEAGQIDMTEAQATQAFTAGTLGIYATSTSDLTLMTTQIGDRFKLKTGQFPLGAQDGKLPAGGNSVMMFTKDEEKQKAAWEYIKFVTGAEAQTLMAQKTGYMPGNDIAIKDDNLLGSFYKNNPNYMTTIRQLPIMVGWYAFPGDNALKITDVIKDQMQAVITLTSQPEDALKKAVDGAQELLPH